MNLNKILTLLFIVLLVILLVEGVYYLKINSPASTDPKPIPTKTTVKIPDLKILYQSPSDSEGRTIIYKSSTRPNSGSGRIYIYQDVLMTVIGIAESWESIASTKDYYLVLKDPLTGELNKVRVGFEPSPYYDGNINLTSLHEEDLTSGAIKGLNLRLSDLGIDKTKKTIKKGDAVAAAILPDFSTKGSHQKSRVDNNGVPIANQLYIRGIKGRKI